MVLARIDLIALFVLSVMMGSASAESVSFEYAENIKAEAVKEGTVLQIRSPVGGDEWLEYLLVPKGFSVDGEKGFSAVIPVPVERIVSLSTTYLGPLAVLDERERVVAVDDGSFATDPDFRARFDAGDIAEIGPPGRLDLESLLAVKPDLVLLTRVGKGSDDLEERLARLGIPVLITSAWKENSPLGRAEWIKFFGLITGKEDRAAEIFSEVSERYNSLEGLTRFETNGPTVLLSAPYGGVWYVPGGRSYSAQFIKDAGAHYLWSANEETGSFPLDFEAVFRKGLEAEFWLNPGGYRSLEELAAKDVRFTALPSFRSGQVYNRTRLVGPAGGNAFWEYGAVRPDQVLADLIAVFFPNLLPEHEFVFYEKLK